MDSHTSTAISTPTFSHSHPLSIKLNDENFLIWRQQVLATVTIYGLEGFLSGDQEAPPAINAHDSSPNPVYLAWRRQDQLLSAWLQGSLSESTMIHVVGLSSSKDIWQAIQTSYASQSKAKVMQYKLQLQTFKKNDLSMRDYLNKIKRYCDLLRSAGCSVSEHDHILYILGGLGSEYDQVMVNVTSRDSGWSVQDVGALLHSFESRLEAARSSPLNTDGSQPSANVAFTNNHRDGRNGVSNPPRSDGRSYRGRRGGRGRFGTGRLTCQVCQKPGHSADRCWYRFDQGYSPQAPRAHPPIPGFQPPPTANLVHARPHHGYQTPLCSRQPPSSIATSEFGYDAASTTSWYPDSGATNHVTNDFLLLALLLIIMEVPIFTSAMELV